VKMVAMISIALITSRKQADDDGISSVSLSFTDYYTNKNWLQFLFL